MSATSVKTCSYTKRNYTKYSGVVGAIALSLLLWGCSKPFSVSDTQWKTYSNSRYSFEFPYPSNWTVVAAPENDDGIALVSPRSQNVEIRAWASNRLPDVANAIQPNFQTTQGISGVLLVEVDQHVGLMKLTLTQGQVTYYWQGKSPSQEFSKYYPLFYYIAQQYRIKV
ncbi:hypothetical protein IQ244_02855 [Nostoc sp. LEGE 06077]|uniref:hypothetical protein n=1 Tax=Nostoc sp. LEGE 06077 TaxID=915325 RepID=UPI00187EEA5C|nr:hypothetical protein [Nostoc sp. LEGE 06077]MBE9205488.1 hypothetical protein [Nostoc sp. LEGE 06077]